MKMKNTLLMMLPVVVSSCVVEKKPINYDDEYCKYSEEIGKLLKDYKENFEKICKDGSNFDSFFEFEKKIIDEAKKGNAQVLDVEGKKFIDLYKDENILSDFKNKLGNLGTAMFLVSNLRFFINPVYQKNGGIDAKTFSYDFLNKRKEIDNIISIQQSLRDGLKVSVFKFDDKNFDLLSKIFNEDYKCQNLEEWFKLFSLFGYSSIENLLLPVEFKDSNDNVICRGFVCDSLNGIDWGVLFEQNVDKDLKNKCFNQMRNIFEKVIFNNVDNVSKKIRFYCNEKSIWDDLLNFYKGKSSDKIFSLGKFRDFLSYFHFCFCNLDVCGSLDRASEFGSPVVNFQQRHGLYCCNFSGSLDKKTNA